MKNFRPKHFSIGVLIFITAELRSAGTKEHSKAESWGGCWVDYSARYWVVLTVCCWVGRKERWMADYLVGLTGRCWGLLTVAR